MRYQGTIYRPPSEANSLLIQATIGCPHNKCTFCSMYKGTRFRLRPVKEIKEDLQMAQQYYGPYVQSLFFPDGNTIIMKTEQLLEILSYAKEMFPYLQRITVYGSARFVNKKSDTDLKLLREAGLDRIHMGMESGDAIVLERIKKGTTPEEIISAGLKLKRAGIQISEYYLTGIGGKDRSYEHAYNSAKVLSAISPNFLRIRTLRLIRNTPLYEEWQRGEFQPLTPHEALQELKVLVTNLDCQNTMVLSDHMLNYWNIHGKLPEDRDFMLNEIDKALTLDEELLKPDFRGHL
jgi:radical SAM superfamily enzyme YgiQ (UPF0313 family)